jgi:hypothetical protein
MNYLFILIFITLAVPVFADTTDEIQTLANDYCTSAPRFLSETEVNEVQAMKLKGEIAIFNNWCDPKKGFIVPSNIKFPASSLTQLTVVEDAWKSLNGIFSRNDPMMYRRSIGYKLDHINRIRYLLLAEEQSRTGKIIETFKNISARERDEELRKIETAALKLNSELRKASSTP